MEGSFETDPTDSDYLLVKVHSVAHKILCENCDSLPLDTDFFPESGMMKVPIEIARYVEKEMLKVMQRLNIEDSELYEFYKTINRTH